MKRAAILGLVLAVMGGGKSYATLPLRPPVAADADRCLDATRSQTPEAQVEACDAALKSVSEADAGRERLLLARGRALDDLDRFAQAEADGEAAIKLSPADPDALVLRGEARSFAEKNDAAMADFDAALKLKPDHATALMRRAQIWQYNRSDPAKARQDYDAAIKADPKLARAWYFRGNLRAENADYAGAADDFTQSLALDPDNSVTARALGVAYEDLHRRPDAMATYDAILRRHPDDAITLTYRASVRLDAADLTGALADAEAAIADDPASRRAYRIKAEVLDRQGKLAAAIEIAEVGLTYGRDDGGILSDLGDYYQRAGKLDQALAALDAAVRADPDDADHLVDRADVLDKLDKGDKAAADYDAAIKLDAKSAYARNERGRHRLNRSEYDQALADFDAAIQIDGKYDAAYFNRALTLKYASHDDQAIAAFDAYLKMVPGDADALDDKGDCYRELGDDLLAVENLDAAIRAKPTLALAWWRRSLAKADMGDAAGAKADKTQALKLDPHVGD